MYLSGQIQILCQLKIANHAKTTLNCNLLYSPAEKKSFFKKNIKYKLLH